MPLYREEKAVRFLIRTGLATGVIVIVLALASVSWREYSARSSCASVGGPAAQIVADGGSAMLVDEALPEYQIGEKHSVFIGAPPERVFESLERDTGDKPPVIKLFELLMIFGDGRASAIFEADKPVLDWLRKGNDSVLEEPNQEVVFVNEDKGTKGTLNFRVDPVEGGSRLTTETRVMFEDQDSCREFGRYWGVMYPGSSLHRFYFLETIKHRVEHGAGTALSPDGRGKHPETTQVGGVA